MRGLVIAIAAIGCGRVDFGPVRLDATSDAVPDAAANVQLVAAMSSGRVDNMLAASVSVAQTAGNLVVVVPYWHAATTVTVSDSLGDAWTGLPIEQLVDSSNCGSGTLDASGTQLWYSQVATTGSNVVTVSQMSTTQQWGIFVLEYSGVGAPDTSSGQRAPASTTVASVPPLTTSGTDLIVVQLSDVVNGGDLLPGSGFTAELRESTFPNMLEDAVLPAGTYTPDGALPPGHNDPCWVGTAAAFHAL